MRLFLSSVLMLASFLGRAQAQDVDKFQTRSAIELFWEACVHQYPDREKFSTWIKQASMKEFPPEAAVGLVKEPTGRAWAIDVVDARYLLVAEDSNLCTLYLKGFDRAVFNQFFQSVQRNDLTSDWIPFDKVDRDLQTSGDAKLTYYRYSRNGKSVLNVVVAEVKPGTTFYEMSLTANMTRTAGTSVPSAPPR
ncbi:MAG TPA: hypothetical protein VK629_18010 [Steroidobacteraceae bacterium]|nr:hypothetical protein [Steroidobacteraceae bacterium]